MLSVVETLTAWQFSHQKRGPSRVFHYSSLDCVLSILESAKLWASDALHLNDASELAYGCDVFSEVLHSSAVPPDVVRQCCDGAESLVLQTAKALGSYVACFCAEGDLLSQWRA